MELKKKKKIRNEEIHLNIEIALIDERTRVLLEIYSLIMFRGCQLIHW